jgi:hypothetical protein
MVSKTIDEPTDFSMLVLDPHPNRLIDPWVVMEEGHPP